MWKEWDFAGNHAVVANAATAEPMEEDEEKEDKEVDMWEGSSTEDLAPEKALAPWATMPVVPRFWVVGLGDQAARRGLAASSRARGKVPAI